MKLICPRCKGELISEAPNQLRCEKDALAFHQVDGIWQFLLPERESHYSRFAADYEAVRHFEGRFSVEAAYYRALPFRDLSGRFSKDWKVRAVSFKLLMSMLPLNCTVLDLGAGNGWLSNRLAQAGHDVCAVDLLTNAEDGLGAWRNYDAKFLPVQAEFLHLPFSSGQVDAAVFNASLHYAESYEAVFSEVLKTLKPNGMIVVMDSPVYHDVNSGLAMLEERKEQFIARYGFASDALQSEGFLTHQRMSLLGEKFGITWEHRVPFYGIRWRLRPWVSRLRRKREPAQFGLWVGKY